MGVLLIFVLAKMGKQSKRLASVMKTSIVDRLYEFIENEARSCSMDFACVTPMYVYRMWGGMVSLEEIEAGLKEIKNGYR